MNSETNCVFCRIDKSEIEAQFLHTDEFCFAINDINPVSPVHLLVIPKFHYRNFKEILDAVSYTHLTLPTSDLV